MRRFSSKAAARVGADAEVLGGDLTVGGIVGRGSASQGAHQVPALEVGFLKRRPDLLGEQVKRQS